MNPIANTTPSPSAPQEVPQWAIHAVHDIETMTRLWVEKDEEERAAAIIARHAQPALTAATEEVERLRGEVQAAWDDASAKAMQLNELRAQLATSRAWGEKAREHFEGIREYARGGNDLYLISDCDAALASHPAEDKEGKL